MSIEENTGLVFFFFFFLLSFPCINLLIFTVTHEAERCSEVLRDRSICLSSSYLKGAAGTRPSSPPSEHGR